MSYYHYGGGPPNGHGPQSSPYPSLPHRVPQGLNSSSDPGHTLGASGLAFELNNSIIPGLGTSSSPGTGPGSLNISSTPWADPQASTEEAVAKSRLPGLSASLSMGPRQGMPSRQLENPAALLRTPLDDTREEGELSEGEFEDLYEPKPSEQTSHHSNPPVMNGTDRRSVGTHGTGESGLYEEEMDDPTSTAALPNIGRNEETLPGSVGENLWLSSTARTGRERSGSYSPHLSPREIQDALDAPDLLQQHRMPPVNQPRREPSTRIEYGPARVVRAPNVGVSSGGMNSAKHDALSHTDTTHQQPTATDYSASQSFYSLADAKKRASAAITSLLPLGVRLQAYLDEGIDETLVKNLFRDLGLESTASKPSLSSGLKATKPPPFSKALPKSSGKEGLPSQSVSGKDSEASTQTAGASEERKDRIKRLLALKAAEGKPNATTSVAASPSVSSVSASADTTTPASTTAVLAATAPATAAPAPTTTASATPSTTAGPVATLTSNKTLLLQQKMEALKKSQGSKMRPVTGSSAPVLPDGGNEPNAFLGSLNLSAAMAPRPGTVLVTNGLNETPRNQRKRPLASDFADFDSNMAIKRPFGHNRDTPLIIDVSDESEGEDMEMDMASPTDAPSQPAQRPEQNRSPALRNHPPLRGLNAHTPTTKPSQTPPLGRQTSNISLQRYEKDIDDLRRKIAEAEAAKQKAIRQQPGKSSLVSSTGSNDSPATTPRSDQATKAATADEARPALATNDHADSRANESQKLPKMSHSGQDTRESMTERRTRIVSTTLPAAQAKLRAKLLKIKLMKAEVAKLEKEVETEQGDVDCINDEISQLDSQIRAMEQVDESVPAAVPQSREATSSEQITSPNVEQSDGVVLPAVLQNQDSSPSNGMDVDYESQSIRNADGSGMASSEEKTDLHTRQEDDRSDGSKADFAVTAPGAHTAHESDAPDAASNPPDTGTNQAAADGFMDERGTELVDTHELDSNTIPATFEINQLIMDQAEESDPLSGSESQIPNEVSPLPDQISGGVDTVDDHHQDGLGHREDQSHDEHSATGFVPYSSPLKYFKAFRFHPRFRELVPGGLRSLTYSNKIDANLPLCPTELAGQSCPKGKECEYQHFESMAVPDDQILLQLGGNASYDEDQKQQYINGLRDLLFNFRVQKVKEFDIIAQSIIDYRAKFNGDTSKILPLGDVSI